MKNKILRLTLLLDNFLYKIISKLARNNGQHLKHQITNYADYFLNKINKTDYVLDIGCNTGELTFKLAKKAKKVIGIDFSISALKKANEENKLNNIKYVLLDATKLEKSIGVFDVISLSNFLEHINSRVVFLKKITSLMKNKKSKILIRVPMFERSWIVGLKKKYGISYKLDEEHKIEYKVDNLLSELTRAGLNFKDIEIKWGEIYVSAYKK
jgi:ubiquinone/menaquinone biosynthesis C-methylase UbiE